MPLHVHGHARVEHLASALARDLAASSLDPFAVAPIVVGSRGMERWLRHQLATAHGIAANLAFPFPRQALDGMALRILGVAGGGPWWQPDDASRAFGAERLTLPVWQALRARAGHPAFADAAAYLDLAAPAQTGVSARQWAFARQVGDVVDKLMHDRHREALRWARDPAAAGEHAWLAHLLGDVGALHDRSPARVRERLDRAQPSASHTEGHVLRLFCLSTLGPADRELLAALARHVPVVVYALAPSHQWWTDLRSNREAARALARAADVGERSRVLADLATQNALLGQLGAPSRDMQAWIEAQDYTEGTGPAPVGEPERSTALGWLQGWVGDAAPMDTAMPPELVGDGSVELLSCWGALRQAEVLRDRLLDLFQRFPGEVAPRDVLVMTPDAQRFAPLVAAVFARRGRGRAADGTSLELPAIPVHIADMGLRRTNPVAEALIAVLALAEGRVSAPAVFDLLELEAVQTRLGLQADDVADLRTLVDASGMRWGLDASDRGAAGQPELDQNTLEFGLERLACGVLMAPIAPGEVASAEGRALAPHPVESAERARRVAALARLLRAVRAVRQRQFDAAAGRTVAQWRAEWTQLLCDFTATTPATAWLSAQVHAALDEFVAQSGDWPGLLTLGAVRRALADRFDMPVRGDRPITGAVTVCALQPMRSVPFAVIALIGMDDGAFPAVAAPRAWDPFAVQRPGELDGRLVQRHLLLETLLSARRQLLVLFDGHGIQPEDRRPAAVPIEELVDVLTRLSGRDRTAWVTDTTLQPWDPGAFSGPRPPFDQAHADAATALLAAARADPPPGPLGLAATVAALCPPEDVPPTSVGVQELALGLAEPQGLFLDQRLHIRLPRDREPLADREPLELGHLDGWQVRELLLADRGLRAGEPPAAVAARVTRRLAAEGRLPMAAGGAVLVADYVAELCEVLALLARGQGAPIDPPLIAVDIDVSAAGRPQRLRVQGTPPAVQAWQGQWLLQWIVANVEPKPKHELAAWIHLLAARAAGLPAIGARVVGGRAKAGSKGALAEATLACDLPPAQALALLGDYGRIWLAARHRPLPLFARTSSCLASAVAEGATGREMAKKIAVPWFGNENSAGECEDRHIAAFFGHYDAPADVADPRTDGLRDLAQRVWLPIATARGAGEALAKAWQGPQEGLS